MGFSYGGHMNRELCVTDNYI